MIRAALPLQAFHTQWSPCTKTPALPLQSKWESNPRCGFGHKQNYNMVFLSEQKCLDHLSFNTLAVFCSQLYSVWPWCWWMAHLRPKGKDLLFLWRKLMERYRTMPGPFINTSLLVILCNVWCASKAAHRSLFPMTESDVFFLHISVKFTCWRASQCSERKLT